MHDDLPIDEPPSKTRVKKTMHELQALGDTLVGLSAAQLAGFDLPEDLAQAIAEARRISSHGARRRQLQYIGRLMRDIDAGPIRARLADLEGTSREARARQKQLERWRERLIADDAALTEYAVEHDGVDVQALRTLIRNARRELEAGKPPRAQRELFRFLREARQT
jgi:ribosome-associated protein